jgi:hypothetical protein
MNHRKFEILFVYFALLSMLLSGCAAFQPTAYGVAPLQYGEVTNLYQGYATWLARDGDALVHTFHNATTGVTVYTRPLVDGWSIACENAKICSEIVGYFTNIHTYKDLHQWMLGAGGFTEVLRNLPPLPNTPMPTILFLPAVMVNPGVLESMSMQAAGFGVYDEAGNYVGSRFSFTADGSDGFLDESVTWEMIGTSE